MLDCWINWPRESRAKCQGAVGRDDVPAHRAGSALKRPRTRFSVSSLSGRKMSAATRLQ